MALRKFKSIARNKSLEGYILSNNSTPRYETRLKIFTMLPLETLCVVSDLFLLNLFKSITRLGHLLDISFIPTFSSHKPSRVYRHVNSKTYHNCFFNVLSSHDVESISCSFLIMIRPPFFEYPTFRSLFNSNHLINHFNFMSSWFWNKFCFI